MISVFVIIVSLYTVGFLFQLIQSWIMELVYLWEKKHADRENEWMYKL